MFATSGSATCERLEAAKIAAATTSGQIQSRREGTKSFCTSRVQIAGFRSPQLENAREKISPGKWSGW